MRVRSRSGTTANENLSRSGTPATGLNMKAGSVAGRSSLRHRTSTTRIYQRSGANTKPVEKTAIEEYCSLVLSRSAYPFPFSKDYQLHYLPDTQVLALDYGLPSIYVVPSLKEARFIKTRQEIKNSISRTSSGRISTTICCIR